MKQLSPEEELAAARNLEPDDRDIAAVGGARRCSSCGRPAAAGDRALRRKHVRRLQRFLQKHKLLFLRVGGRASEDRVIGMLLETKGSPQSNPEYNTLLRAIVACILEPR